MRARRVVLVVAALGVVALPSCGRRAERVRRASGTTTTSVASTTTSGGDLPTGETLARYAGYESTDHAGTTHWLCRPDTPEDICHSDLDATVVEADGTTRLERFEAAASPKVDCFYVYPTISKDAADFSDWEPSPGEEGYAALNQAARLRSVCRLFAPVYRQRTLQGLATGATAPPGAPDPYDDVLDAWKTYMATDNGGRGVVLIGHSQGSFVLGRLLAEEIDPNPDVRALLVGAYLPGAGLAVPDGEVVGGAFQHVPMCRAEGDVGCVESWATFRSTSPPPAGALFGRPRGGADGEAICTNPAALAGGEAPLDAYLPARAGASILSALGTDAAGRSWLPGTVLDTPFVRLPGLVRGECVRRDGFHYLEARVQADPGPRADDIAGDLSPAWGLHLVDLSIVQGDLIARVRDQADAFAS